MDSEFVFSCMMMLMLMSFSQHYLFHQQTHILEGHVIPASPLRHRRHRRYEPPIPYNIINRFTFIGMNDVLCHHLTRFTVAEIQRLLPLLALQEIRFRNRLQATPEEAFAVVLIRLSYPIRYWNMMDRFGHSRTWLSIVFNDTIIHIYKRFRKTLEWDNRRLTYAKLSEFSLAIHRLGGGHCLWGFIDGTLNATCRPVIDQHQYYSGHKRKHGYKYQSIVTPDGMVSSLMGPFIGRRGDWRMVELSGLEAKLRAVNAGRRPTLALYLYGNPAYSTVYGIIGPYKNYPGRPRTAAHNRCKRLIHGATNDTTYKAVCLIVCPELYIREAMHQLGRDRIHQVSPLFGFVHPGDLTSG